MKSDIPLITQADIERWAGSASFQKGSSYSQHGMIYKPYIKGYTLQARCHGSQAASHQVQATLGPNQILTAMISPIIWVDSGS